MDLSDEWDDINEPETDKFPELKKEKEKKKEEKEEDEEDWSDVIAIEVLENYSCHLMKQMETFRKDGIMCDAVIVVDDQELPVHKNVLSAVSPFFKNIFSRLTDPNDNRITLRNLTGLIMEDILHFAYTGEACIHDGNVRQLVGIANFLQLTNLKEMGITFLEKKLSTASAVEILLIADKHKCENLVISAEKLIKDNFGVVSKTDGFKKLTFEMLYQFISSEDIRVLKEEEVYEAVVSWMKSDFGNQSERLNQMPDFFQEIRFPLISPPYLREILEREELVMHDQICYNIVSDAQQYVLDNTHKYSFHNKMLKPRIFMGIVSGLVSAGGWLDNKPTKAVYAYMVSDAQWYPLSPLPSAKYNHSVISSEEYIFVLGGRNECSQLLSSVIRFDTNANIWQTVKSLPFKAASLGACVFQGQIFVAGGLANIGSISAVLRYSPRYNNWQRVASLNYARGGAALVAGEKYMFSIGGVNKSGQGVNARWEYLDSMEVFERESNTWTYGKSMPTKRAYGNAVYLNQKIYVIGGQVDLTGSCKEMSIYDTAAQEWSTFTFHNSPRTQCGIACTENDFYTIGGVSKDGECSCNVETYNVNTKKWKKSTPLPIALGAMQCCTMKLRLGVLQGLKVNPTASSAS